jgi:hypothetical protein
VTRLLVTTRDWFHVAFTSAVNWAMRRTGLWPVPVYAYAEPTTTASSAVYFVRWTQCHTGDCLAAGAWDHTADEYWCAEHGWHPEYRRWVRAWTRSDPTMREALLSPPSDPITYAWK